jgi:uncharacterized protein
MKTTLHRVECFHNDGEISPFDYKTNNYRLWLSHISLSTSIHTVEKYQGGERDIVAVCGTVSDPAAEEQFILNPSRLLVAISRSRLLTIVVCSDALFEVAPRTRDNLDNGPVWARLFTEAIGETPDPTWAGSLSEFTGEESDEYSTVPVTVYTS